jgi:TolB-like protein
VDKPFPAYEGQGPYVFVSYAHEDASEVYPEMQWLREQGFNIWYDDGLRPGSEWHAALAQAIENCSLCLFFVSPRSAQSAHCQREVHYALDQHRVVIAVHLEKSELPSGLRLALSNIQAILRHDLNAEQYRSKLVSALADNVSQTTTQTFAAAEPRAERSSRPFAVAGLFIGLAILTAFAYLYLDSRGNPPPDEAFSESRTAPDAIRSNWVAILPFRAVSTSTQASLLAEGITGELIHSLSGLSMFSVVSHGSVLEYTGSSLSSREISGQLNVRYLIEGRVQISQEQTRVSVTLARAIATVMRWLCRTMSPGLSAARSTLNWRAWRWSGFAILRWTPCNRGNCTYPPWRCGKKGPI